MEKYRNIQDKQKSKQLLDKAIGYYLGIGKEKSLILTKQLLKESAALGSTEAINLLADLYVRGELYCEDLNEVVKLYEQGWKLGDSRSLFHLALCYAKGRGVERDDTKAVELYRQAYEAGNSDSCFNLALCCKKGVGVARSTEQEIMWYKRGMEMSDDACACNLGFCYYNGEGVARDYDKARELFVQHSNYSSLVQRNIGVIYYKGTKTISPNLIKAIEWLTTSACNGDVSSMICLGNIYKKDKNDIDTALEWYRKAAEKDKKKGAYMYGFHLYKYGKEDDWNNAFYWIKRSAENKHVASEFLLALFYQCGVGTTVDHAKAFYWYNIAAENDYEQAYSHIGRYYRDGRIVTKNFEAALFWFEKAISSTNVNVRSEALFDYGRMYLEGQGVLQNIDKAIDFFMESKELGCINAENKLKELGVVGKKLSSKKRSSIIKNANIIEFIKMKIEDKTADPKWGNNILPKLMIHIECAQNAGLIEKVIGCKHRWTKSNKDYAQWILFVSDNLKLYIETGKRQKKYYPDRFAKMVMTQKGKEFNSQNIRHDMSDINTGEKEVIVRNYDILKAVVDEAKKIIKSKKL